MQLISQGLFLTFLCFLLFFFFLDSPAMPTELTMSRNCVHLCLKKKKTKVVFQYMSCADRFHQGKTKEKYPCSAVEAAEVVERCEQEFYTFSVFISFTWLEKETVDSLTGLC